MIGCDRELIKPYAERLRRKRTNQRVTPINAIGLTRVPPKILLKPLKTKALAHPPEEARSTGRLYALIEAAPYNAPPRVKVIFR